jgi:hypothetical protein
MEGRKVKFTIMGCKISFHRDEHGANAWLVAFVVQSEEICYLRNRLGLRFKPNFNAHLTILENEI